MPKTIFKRAAPYANDALNLPVRSVDAAIPFYEYKLGFRLVSREDRPMKRALLERDGVQIGLAENGGDFSQEGCFFEVNDVSAAFEEINGASPTDEDLQVQEFGRLPFLCFSVVAPDGLCFIVGERKK
jgi:catechol 2,3-dioxygenase-like lactoylglutathione lyase family enzyme